MLNEEMMKKVDSIVAKLEDTKVTKEEVEAAIKEGEITLLAMPNGVTTYVELELANGFRIVETSTCKNKEDYDENKGLELCMVKIKKRLHEYMLFYKCQVKKDTLNALKFLKPAESNLEKN